MRALLPHQSSTNQDASLSNPLVIDELLSTECSLGTICSPFIVNPLSIELAISPLQIAHSCKGKPCVVVNLSYPFGHSVNCGNPCYAYLSVPFSLHLPGLDTLLDIVHHKGPSCDVFEKDLSQAYHQLHINPCDYHLLGYKHHGNLFFDTSQPFVLGSPAMTCQNSTSAVTFMYQNLGYACTNPWPLPRLWATSYNLWV